MLEIVLTSPESDPYPSAPTEISKFPLMYMTGYFCRSVYNLHFGLCTRRRFKTTTSHNTNKSIRLLIGKAVDVLS